MRSRPISLLQLDEEERQESLHELRANDIALNEKSLLECAERANGYTSVCATEALAYMDASSPHLVKRLKKLVAGKDSDLSTVALLTIARLIGSKETPYYAELIRANNYKEKLVPASILWEVGNERALPDMRWLAGQITQRKIVHIQWDNDPLYVSEYLRKYSHEPGDIEKAEQLEQMYRKAAWGYPQRLIYWLSRGRKG